ncbi:MAG: TIGR01440 family protein [Clostridia bacterium]|nr:TIGR01440 family protein [Clostridia bacterium]
MSISQECILAANDLIEKAKLKKGNIVIIGCSTSEVLGSRIGTDSSPDTAKILFESLYGIFNEKGIYVAAQCCEHLNRAIIIEKDAVPFAETANVIPAPKAGGSFATEAYKHFKNPVAVEEIKADAGIDIGATLIGMHLKKVAVPLRLCVKTIGEAPVTAARTRPKFIGGVRANYDENLL